MSTQLQLEEELERRLNEIEELEKADPSHAKLGAGSLTVFLVVVGGIAAAAWIGALL